VNARKVLIVDDHSLIRHSIAEVLERKFGCRTREVSDASEAWRAILKENWDLILVDATLPGRSGLSLSKEINHAHPKLPMLVFNWQIEKLALRVLRARGAGYRSTDSPAEILVQAIAKVLRGDRYVSIGGVQRAAGVLAEDSILQPHELLSDREYDVMRRLASGKTVSQVASELHLSVKTISTYRVRMLEKMGLKTNAEVTQYAIGHRLVGSL